MAKKKATKATTKPKAERPNPYATLGLKQRRDAETAERRAQVDAQMAENAAHERCTCCGDATGRLAAGLTATFGDTITPEQATALHNLFAIDDYLSDGFIDDWALAHLCTELRTILKGAGLKAPYKAADTDSELWGGVAEIYRAVCEWRRRMKIGEDATIEAYYVGGRISDLLFVAGVNSVQRAEAMATARHTGAQRNRDRAMERHEPWQAEANKIWSRDPKLSKNKVAIRIIELGMGNGAKAATIARAIRPPGT